MPSGRGTILFVDDNDTLRRVLSTVLEEEGYQVLQLRSATDARAALEGGTVVDLAICNVVLRGSGTSREFITHLKKVRPGVPLLVISGFGATQTADLLSDSILATVLQKPFTVEELLERVAALIQPRAHLWGAPPAPPVPPRA